MAIIYTYPRVSSLEAEDCMIISDDSDGKKTKSVALSTIKSFVGGGSAAMLTVQTSNGGTVVNNVTDIKVTDSTLTDNGNGVVTINTGGSGSIPGGDQGSIQYNDNNSFEGSPNLKVALDQAGTATLQVKNQINAIGNGAEAGKLNLYCDAGNAAHYVRLEGPDHNTQGITSYTIKMPAIEPVSGDVLTYTNAAVANPYEWKQPTAYPTETTGTFVPILGTQVGAGYSLEALGAITVTTKEGSWRRIGKQMYYDFYIEFTIIDQYPQANTLVLGQAKDSSSPDDVFPLPVDNSTPAIGQNPSPTLKANQKANGSCQIAQTTTDNISKMWVFMPQTGKVGRTTAGIVDLASHNYDPAVWDPSSVTSIPLHTSFENAWWGASAVGTNNVIAGTIIGVSQ